MPIKTSGQDFPYALMFDKPEKSVIYGPFRMWPKPPWFINNEQAHKIFPRLVQMEAKPGFFKTLRVVLAAIKVDLPFNIKRKAPFEAGKRELPILSFEW